MKPKAQKTVDVAALAEAFSGPAVLANYFYLTVGPTLRLAFCEHVPNKVEPQFRVAVALSHKDAAALADLIQKTLAQIAGRGANIMAARAGALAKRPPGNG